MRTRAGILSFCIALVDHHSMTNDPDLFLEAAAKKREPIALTEHDVAGLLQISVSKLQKMREQDIKPPVWMRIGTSVRYPAALLKQWIESGGEPGGPSTPGAGPIQMNARSIARPMDSRGYDEPLFRGGRRKKVKHANFAQFLREGHLSDEWLFVLRGAQRRPVDWLATLDDAQRDDAAEVVWLNLGDYLALVHDAAAREQGEETGDGLKSVMRTTGNPGDGGRL